MRWPHDRQEPTAKTDIHQIADRLWETADELRANSHLKAGEYSIPVLGLIFLKFADSRFTQAEAELAGKGTGRRQIGKADYQAKGVLYLPEQSRFANLLELKEGDNLGKAINDAMAAIEEENPALKGVLPRTYQSLTNDTLVSLLRSVNAILGDIEGDAFGKVYEYFLGKFAIAEGAKGGEYFTPTSIVRLIVEIIEPFNGKILDPGLRVRRHVRPERALRRRAPQRQGRPALDLRPGARRRDPPPLQDEPRRSRPRGPDQPVEHLLRRPVQGHRPVRLRDGQSAVQRQQGRQGEARRRQALPVRASRRPTTATTSGFKRSTRR